MRSGAPVRVLAEAYYQGQEIPVATIRERELPAPDGGTDATLIFHWPEQATPVIGDPSGRHAFRPSGKRLRRFPSPVNLIWGSEPAHCVRLPQWVHDFEAQREREHALDPDYQAYRKATNKTRTGWIAAALDRMCGIALGGSALVDVAAALARVSQGRLKPPRRTGSRRAAARVRGFEDDRVAALTRHCPVSVRAPA